MRAAGLLLLLAGPALAQEPTGAWTSAEAAFAAARAAERAGDPAGEVTACEAVVATGPGRQAERCADRLALLDTYRDPDGGLDGLARLEAARRIDEPEAQRVAVAAVEADGSAGRAVRSQAAAWLLSLALREGARSEARAVSDRWWPPEVEAEGLSALALPEKDARRLARLRVRLLHGLGEDGAAAEVEALLQAADGHAAAVGELGLLERRAQRARLGRAGQGVLGLWALVAVPLGLAGWIRGPRPVPLGLVPLAVVGGGGLLLAWLWAPEVVAPFAGLLGLLGLMHLLAVGASVRLRDRLGAGLFGLASGLASFGAAAVVLEAAGLWAWVGL